MINVPDFVKRMFRTDGVLKYYSIFSPNNEFPEINNDNIIKESVKFTESLCSQNNLKFGLCESSVLRFSCFGVGNITGYEIKASVEVDCSSVPASERSGYSFHTITHNGETLYLYTIKLGRFVVDSAEKDANTSKRNIIAYSIDNEMVQADNDYLKINTLYGASASINLHVFNYAICARNNLFNKLDGLTYTEISGYSGPTTYAGANKEEQSFTKVKVTVSFDNYYSKADNGVNGNPDAQYIGYIDSIPTRASTNGENSITTAISALQQNRSVRLSNSEVLAIIDWFKRRVMMPHTNFSPKGLIPWDNHYTCSGSVQFWGTIKIKFTSLDPNNTFTPYETTGTFFDSTAISAVKLYSVVVDTSIYPDIYIPMTSAIYSGSNYSFSQLFVNLGMKDLLQAYCEMCGMFVGNGRDGYMKFYRVDMDDAPLFPQDILYPSEDLYPSGTSDFVLYDGNNYISAIYDEKLMRCGGISVTYNDSSIAIGKETEYTEDFVYDVDERYYKYYVYNINDNAIIKAKTYTDYTELLSDIDLLLDVLKVIQYYPATSKIKGIPYIEKGDTVYLQTQDTTLVLPILRRTMSGIQDLRDTIASQ